MCNIVHSVLTLGLQVRKSRKWWKAV